MNTKIPVKNPIDYFTTVGEELEDIIISNDVSLDLFLSEMNWEGKDIKSITSVTKTDAIKIEKLVKVDSICSYVLKFQNEFKESNAKAQLAYKSNLKVYRKVQHLLPLLRDEFKQGIDILDDISDFLDIDDESQILERVKENIALYKISNFVPHDLNLYAWLRRGQLDFYQKNLCKYDKNLFLRWIESKDWQKNLTHYGYIQKLPYILEKFGVGLVCTPYFEKTVFGAVRWFDNKPLVQVSDKGKCLATFWYTLFHEFGHVIRHENDEIFEGQSDLSKSALNKKEKEANSFAYQYLFNGDDLRKNIFGYFGKSVEDDFINQKAKRFNVDTIFVVYWMKKANIKCNSSRYRITSFNI